MREFLLLPTSLYSRLCLGLLLTFLLAGVAGILPVLAFASTESAPLRVVASIGVLGLGVWFLFGYRRQQLPTLGLAVEAPILVLVTIAVAQPSNALGLLFPWVMFRVFHSSVWGYTGAVISVAGAYLIGGLIWPALHGSPATFAVGQIASDLIGFPVVGSVLFGFSLSLRRYEQSAVRQRVLAGAGTALMAARNRAEVCTAAQEAVCDLLTDALVGRVSLTVGAPAAASLEIVAAGGDPSENIRGSSIYVSPNLATLHLMTECKQASLEAAACADLQQALGFTPHLGIVTLVALRARGEQIGVLVVESKGWLPEDSLDGLRMLAAEVALALDGARLIEDLRCDVTEREALATELEHRAFHDPLTDLPNRTLLIERADQALARNRTSLGTALIFVDLDDFKAVNDTFGHQLGDELLVEVAKRLRGAARPGDTAARMGGDEFVVLLEDISDQQDAIRVAERILDALRMPLQLASIDVPLSASVGIAVSGGPGTRADHLLRDADAAMYAAKMKGKQRYEVFR